MTCADRIRKAADQIAGRLSRADAGGGLGSSQGHLESSRDRVALLLEALGYDVSGAKSDISRTGPDAPSAGRRKGVGEPEGAGASGNAEVAVGFSPPGTGNLTVDFALLQGGRPKEGLLQS